MNKAIQLGAAFAGAAIVVAAGTAYTDANTGATATKAGYFDQTTSGVAVTKTEYNIVENDATQLDSVVWTTAAELATATHAAYMTITSNGTAADSVSCTIAGTTPNVTMTCDAAASTLVAEIDSIALTVVSDGQTA